MKPVSAHHLLSAYLDGELSPGERDEVERLLSESPEARQELGELEQVRELLRQLPRESLPKTFASGILAECESRPRGSAATASDVKTPSKVQAGRSWMRLAALAVSAAAALVIVWFAFPHAGQENSELAQTSPDHRSSTESPSGDSTLRSQPPQPMAPGNELADARNLALPPESPIREPAAPQKTAGAGIVADSFQRKGLSAADRESQLVFGHNLKDVPIGQVVEALDQQGDKIAVVKLTVVDRQQGLRDLQVLLKKHQIVSADTPKLGETGANARSPSQNSSLLAVYVETSDNQLAAAMRELQKEAAFRQLTIDAPITVAGLDPLITSPEPMDDAQRRNRVQPFGAAGADVPGLQSINPAQIKMKAARTPQPAPAAEPGRDKTPAPFKAEAQTAPAAQSQPPAGEKKTAARFGTPRAATASNGQQKTPADEKRDAPKFGAFQRGFGGGSGNFHQTAPSRQRQLTLPANVLDELQKKRAGTEAKKQSEADGTGTNPAAEEKTAKRVHILFVLVDEPEKTESESAPPAKKPAPPADNNNGAA